MILHVQQVKQEMFAADFNILRNNTPVGSMQFRGKLSSRDGHWNYDLYARKLELGHNATIRNGLPRNAYRPYQIYENQKLTGYVFNDTVKQNFFTSYSVAKVYWDDAEYIMYFIGFGEEGAKNPIYRNGVQVAQIEKDCTVYNGLYQYKLYAKDEISAHAAVMLCSYMYSCAGYEPGLKVAKAVQKAVSITKNKEILSKYDPSFCDGIER